MKLSSLAAALAITAAAVVAPADAATKLRSRDLQDAVVIDPIEEARKGGGGGGGKGGKVYVNLLYGIASGPIKAVGNDFQVGNTVAGGGFSRGLTQFTVKLGSDRGDSYTEKFTIYTLDDDYMTFTAVCPEEYPDIGVNLSRCTEDGTTVTCPRNFGGDLYTLERLDRPIGSGGVALLYDGDLSGTLESVDVEIECYDD